MDRGQVLLFAFCQKKKRGQSLFFLIIHFCRGLIHQTHLLGYRFRLVDRGPVQFFGFCQKNYLFVTIRGHFLVNIFTSSSISPGENIGTLFA